MLVRHLVRFRHIIASVLSYFFYICSKYMQLLFAKIWYHYLKIAFRKVTDFSAVI